MVAKFGAEQPQIEISEERNQKINEEILKLKKEVHRKKIDEYRLQLDRSTGYF